MPEQKLKVTKDTILTGIGHRVENAYEDYDRETENAKTEAADQLMEEFWSVLSDVFHLEITSSAGDDRHADALDRLDSAFKCLVNDALEKRG